MVPLVSPGPGVPFSVHMGSLQEQVRVSFTTVCFQQGCFLSSTWGIMVLCDTSSPSSSRQHSSHRHVPAVHSARGRGCNTAAADGWRGCKWQQETGSSVAGSHAQGTMGRVGEAEVPLVTHVWSGPEPSMLLWCCAGNQAPL